MDSYFMQSKKRILNIYTTIKNGWNEVSWALYALFSGGVLYKLFGVSGLTGTLVVAGFLYAVGRYHPALNGNKIKK